MRGDAPVSQIWEQLADIIRDPVQVAAKTFEWLETLKPTTIPRPCHFSDPSVIDAWRYGGKIPDMLATEFQSWLIAAKHRSEVVAENKRRLRTTLWAEATLTASGHGDLAKYLSDFHRMYWRIPAAPLARDERERVVTQAVGAMSGAGLS